MLERLLAFQAALRADETARFVGFLLGAGLLLLAVRYGARKLATLAPGVVPARRQASAAWLYALIGLAAVGLLFVARDVLHRFPNSGDEDAYVFQAQTLLAGRLWNEAHPLPEFFNEVRVFQKDGKWIGQYPPGWPAALALGALIGLPFWAVGPVVGALLLACFARLARRTVSWNWAIGGTLAVATAPYFLLTAASHYSHAAVALAGLVFAYYGRRFLEAPRWGDALLAGMALGVAGLSRPHAAVLFMLPFAAAVGLRLSWRHAWRSTGVALGGLPFLAVLLLYQYQVTGNALMPVVNWVYPGTEPIGLVNAHSSGNTFTSLRLLGEWTSPLLLAAYLLALAYKGARRELHFDNVCLLLFIVGFLFYDSLGDTLFGPRYYFEAFPLGVLAVVEAVHQLAKRDAARSYALAGLAAHILVQLGVAAWQIPDVTRLVGHRLDLYRLVAREQLQNAVVFVRSSTGVVRPLEADNLVRNGISFDRPVLYARDRGDDNRRLMAYYPERRFYVYVRQRRSPTGELVPVAAAH